MTTRGDEEELEGGGTARGSSDHERERIVDRIGDAHLPEDLRPGDDNPLAEGLGPSETAGDLGPGELLDDGKRADQEPASESDHELTSESDHESGSESDSESDRGTDQAD